MENVELRLLSIPNYILSFFTIYGESGYDSYPHVNGRSAGVLGMAAKVNREKGGRLTTSKKSLVIAMAN